jgi:predicted ATPase
MKVINLFGGPGSGKSTTAAGLFYRMKLAGHKVELVTEYAKDLVYAGQLGTMLEQQEYIFAEQNWRLQRLLSHVDWAITDSPILLSAIYPELNQKQHGIGSWPALPEFKKLVHAQFRCYNNLNVFLRRPDEYQEWGRERSLDEAKETDSMITKELRRGGYEYVAVKTNPLIVEEILGWLERYHGL